MSLFAPPNLDSIYVSVLSSATVSSATPAVNRVPVTDGVGGIVYLPYGGGGSPDSSFSTLRVANTLSTSSTFTNYLSAGQIYASSLIVQSAVVVGANTLTVLGQTFMSSITVTGQFLISTIPGQPALPLDSAQISSLKVQTSTLNLVDTTNAGSVLPLYNQAGSLYFNGSAVGGGGSVGSNYAFSNLSIADTLSTSSTFTNYLSAPMIQTSTITFNTDITIGSAVPGSAPIKIGYRAGNDTSYDNNNALEYIAIGKQAGEHLRGGDTVGIYIGNFAGQYTELDSHQVAIGNLAGQSYYRNGYAISIGDSAGQISTGGISIGFSAGNSYQGNNAIAIGDSAGQTTQSTNAIAIGYRAGLIAQGVNSIAIGALAGNDGVNTPQYDSTIVLNATGDYFNSAAPQGFYVKPIRSAPGIKNTAILYYEPTTGEIVTDPTGGGGSVGSNYGFSNLLVADTLSTISTFTDFVSAGQVQLSTLYFADATNTTSLNSLYVESGSLKYNGATIGTATIGSNFGFSNLNILDTLSTTSTFTKFISAGQVQLSTLNLVDTTNDTSILPLYNQGGSLYFNGSAVGGGGGGPMESLSLSTLFVADTLSSISTFTSTLFAGEFVSTNFINTNGILNAPGNLVSYSNNSVSILGNKVTYDSYSGHFFATGYGVNSYSSILYSQNGDKWLSVNGGGFSSNRYYSGYNYNDYIGNTIYSYSTSVAVNTKIFAGGHNDPDTTPNTITTTDNPAGPVNFSGTGGAPKLSEILCFGQSNLGYFPTDPTRIYAGGVPGPDGFPLYYSDDFGTNWVPISTTQFTVVRGIATDTNATPSLTYAVGSVPTGADKTSTIQYTQDGGLTWTSADYGFGVGFDITLNPVNGHWYACGSAWDTADTNRVLICKNGVNWNGTVGGVPVSDPVYGIATDGTKIIITGAAANFGPAISTIGISADEGQTWYSATTGGFGDQGNGFSIAYNFSNTQWVAVGQPYNDVTSTIIYSSDGGDNWNSAISGEFIGSNYNVNLNVDYTGLRSDKIIADQIQVNTLEAVSINGLKADFTFQWGAKTAPLSVIKPGLISTSQIQVSSINGVQFPRMYFSTLLTNGSGNAQWDFPKPFSSVDSYSATFTSQYDAADLPYIINVAEKNVAYVQFSSITTIGLATGPASVQGIVMGV